jgi:hypothetical protein
LIIVRAPFLSGLIASPAMGSSHKLTEQAGGACSFCVKTYGIGPLPFKPYEEAFYQRPLPVSTFFHEGAAMSFLDENPPISVNIQSYIRLLDLSPRGADFIKTAGSPWF